jgi:hypothetical protein
VADDSLRRTIVFSVCPVLTLLSSRSVLSAPSSGDVQRCRRSRRREGRSARVREVPPSARTIQATRSQDSEGRAAVRTTGNGSARVECARGGAGVNENTNADRSAVCSFLCSQVRPSWRRLWRVRPVCRSIALAAPIFSRCSSESVHRACEICSHRRERTHPVSFSSYVRSERQRGR